MVPENIKEISPGIWEISKTYKEGMLVPARIFASKKLLEEMDPGVFDQTTNMACLPGIQQAALCMPDGHWGYGFPIGGVAAMDAENGVISPGGIGFDINCGMRLVKSNLTWNEVKPRLENLVNRLFERVPAGTGTKGFVKLDKKKFEEVMRKGARWCVENGYGWPEDLEHMEAGGTISGADPSLVSARARERGIIQLGTLGSGNHYLEIQVIKKENVFDRQIAKEWGIDGEEQVVVMVHCGSRGFGHQVATDYLRVFDKAMPKYGIVVRDRELACAPFKSPEGQQYFAAMACAANMAFANRQVILHRIREVFSEVFGKSAEDLGLRLLYDVAHNLAKLEEHEINGPEPSRQGGSYGAGKKKKVIVHRKGATRAFGPGAADLSPLFKKTGQPVIVGGSMETGSYLLVGTEEAMKKTYGSTTHGSGRTMSRTKAKKQVSGRELQDKMKERGIYVKSVSYAGLAEEAGFAYKNLDEVVDACEQSGISRRVAKCLPVGNIKG